jgi:hypothetical protein
VSPGQTIALAAIETPRLPEIISRAVNGVDDPPAPGFSAGRSSVFPGVKRQKGPAPWWRWNMRITVWIVSVAMAGCAAPLAPALEGTDGTRWVEALVQTPTGLAWLEWGPRGAASPAEESYSLIRWETQGGGRRVVLTSPAATYLRDLVASGEVVYAGLADKGGGWFRVVRSASVSAEPQVFDLPGFPKAKLQAASDDFVVVWDGAWPATSYTRVPLDGGVEVALAGEALSRAAVVEGDVFLITDGGTITRFGAGGATVEVEQPGGFDWLSHLTAVDGRLLWSSGVYGSSDERAPTRVRVSSHRVGEPGVTVLAEEAEVSRAGGRCPVTQRPGPVTADVTHAYWAVSFHATNTCGYDPGESVGYAIRRVALDGQGAVDTLESRDIGVVGALAVDAERVYWVASGDGVVRYRRK